MAGMKDLLFRLQEQQSYSRVDVDVGDLENIATLLGGEVVDRGDGKKRILCASVGYAADDRSCEIKIDPAYPSTSLYIYGCEGRDGPNYAAIREKLKLVTPLRSNSTGPLAIKLWNDTAPAAGTAVERYLHGRGLTMPIPDDLRFHPHVKHKSGRWFPAMIAARRDVDGHIVAVHRTWITTEGKKAPLGDEVKMDLGPVRGTCIRLSPVAEDLLIGEGIENVLSVMFATDRPGWAAGSAIAMRNARLPAGVRRLIFLSDGDSASATAERECVDQWKAEGREIRIARPEPGKDFNKMLLEETEQ